jgi:hypothetical protein
LKEWSLEWLLKIAKENNLRVCFVSLRGDKK